MLWTIGYSQHTNTPSADLPVPYDTVRLKNDHFLVYENNSKRKYLRLTGPNVDTIIRSMDARAADTYLGWLKADFESYFALYVGGGLNP